MPEAMPKLLCGGFPVTKVHVFSGKNIHLSHTESETQILWGLSLALDLNFHVWMHPEGPFKQSFEKEKKKFA